MFTLKGFIFRVPYLPPLLNLILYRRARPLFQGRHRTSLVGYFELGELGRKDMGDIPYNLLW